MIKLLKFPIQNVIEPKNYYLCKPDEDVIRCYRANQKSKIENQKLI